VGKDIDSAAAMPDCELVAAMAAEVVDILKRSYEEGNTAKAEEEADSGSPRTRRYVSKTILLFFRCWRKKAYKVVLPLWYSMRVN
jgi:hypothetical protein